MQPVICDARKVHRFKANAIVRHLLDWASARGCDMNTLAIIPFKNEDRTQFAQLIGYSVSGAGDLSYFSRTVLAQADRASVALARKKKKKR